MPIEIEKNARQSTITIKAPIALEPESQQKVHEYLKEKYNRDILGVLFREEGHVIHLVVRKNYQSFHTMENYAKRVKEMAEGRKRDVEEDDDEED